MDAEPQIDLNAIFLEAMQLYISYNLPVDQIYVISALILCKISQVRGRKPEELLADIEYLYKQMPAPIEEKDESNE